LQYNIDTCPGLPHPKNVVAEGYLWGSPVDKLKAYLPEADRGEGFDVLLLADLLFNHSEHAKLLSTIQQCLKRPGVTAAAAEQPQALVFFTPYRPWLLGKDLAFFDLSRDGGFKVEKIFEEVMEKVMFEEDPGDEKLRRTVFGYRLTWAEAGGKG
jgi:nicotinamide N-methyltransferase